MEQLHVEQLPERAKVTLRESTEEDFEFVFQLNKTNMRPYVEKIRGWDEEYEREDMKKKFTPGQDKIIQVAGENAGVYRVIEELDYVNIDHIELHPKFQNQGIGSSLLRGTIEEAKKNNKPVRLQVLKDNPAQNLYRQLGFKEVGETDLKIQFELKS